MVQCLRQVRQFVVHHQLFSPGDRLLVAVSGGADSVALLRLLMELRDEFRLHLEVAHLGHGIRGEDAEVDARFVASLAEGFGLPFHCKTIDVPQIKAAAGKGNLEALARAERYRFFAEVIQDGSLDKVATAHTQDDQAETMLMWFLRGSGLTGLGGMAPLQRMDFPGIAKGLTVVRPLLGLSKAEILGYLAAKQQSYRYDCTNEDTMLLRNWLRLELLPFIRQRFGGRLNERLGRQAELLRDDDRLLDESARRKLAAVCDADGMRRDGLLAQPTAMQRRLLRLWSETTRGNPCGLDFVHVEKILRLIKEGAPQGRLALPGGWEFVREYDRLKLARRSTKAQEQWYGYDFSAGSSLPIPEAGWEIRSEIIAAPVNDYPTDFNEAIFDIARLTGSLMVRNFRPGDYFQPLGMTGHKKIKDLFIENKLTRSMRATLPLFVSGTEVLWIPGCGRSERAKVTPQSARILKLKLVSLGT